MNRRRFLKLGAMTAAAMAVPAALVPREPLPTFNSYAAPCGQPIRWTLDPDCPRDSVWLMTCARFELITEPELMPFKNAKVRWIEPIQPKTASRLAL